MVAKAKSFPNPRPDRAPEGLGSRRHFPAVSARVRASLVLRRLELLAPLRVSDSSLQLSPAPRGSGRSADARAVA